MPFFICDPGTDDGTKLLATAARKLEAMGYTFADGPWIHPANDAVAPVITDALHAPLVGRADELMACPEDGWRLRTPAITDAIDAYEAVRSPGGRVDSGKG